MEKPIITSLARPEDFKTVYEGTEGLFWDHERIAGSDPIMARIVQKRSRKLIANKVDPHQAGYIVKKHNDILTRVLEMKWETVYK